MNKLLLLEAIISLSESNLHGAQFARSQAVRQFNSLLTHAQALYENRPDIVAMEHYQNVEIINAYELEDAATRLRSAIELRRPGAVTDLVDSIKLPSDATDLLKEDLEEFKGAVGLGLRKSALLLAGSIAEALLLIRHPDKSEKGPGLLRLFNLARDQRLFGRDTLRQLETLNDYRDLIHTRAGPRNKILLTDERVEQAVQALKLLCSELQDPEAQYI